MRLGGPLFVKYDDPETWAKAVKKAGYTASYCPAKIDADQVTIQAYAETAKHEDIIIAEVGAWSNPLSSDKELRARALDKCKTCMRIADEIGANCCVNIAGSLGEKWDGPCKEDLTEEAFQIIVDTVRDIIDSVKPSRSFYSLETMPWMYPDSPDSYLKLIKAIDRKKFAVHLDPVNMICSPKRYFKNSDLIKDCFTKLGPYIKSCHAKDIILRDSLTTHLDEVRPGQGMLNYNTYLRELNSLGRDIPVMLEHLPDENEYKAAAAHIRSVANDEGISI